MRLGISKCLIGHKCRYDGSTAKDDFVQNILSQYFKFESYCPEEMIFPTPRDTIRLVEIENEVKVLKTKNSEDVTQKLKDISLKCVDDMEDRGLCGFILKSKSPTCGLERVKVYQNKNAPSEKKGVGVFAQKILERYPHLPIEEEGRLNDPWLRENFLMQVYAYDDFKKFSHSNPTFAALVEFHTSYKYLIYAKSHEKYKKLGNIVANHKKLLLTEVLAQYEKEFLETIAQKGDIKKTYNVLLHMYGYFKKVISKEEKEEILEVIEDYKNKIIPLVVVMRVLKLYANRFQVEYLQTQKFLSPYPKELALRSDIKAYK